MAKFMNIGKYLGLMYTLKGHETYHDGTLEAECEATIEYGNARISNGFSSRFVAKRWVLETIKQLTGRNET